MNLTEEIVATLALLGMDDIELAKKYLDWIAVRRKINRRFYFAAHWIERPKQNYHWL
jgi:hypothetical protein